MNPCGWPDRQAECKISDLHSPSLTVWPAIVLAEGKFLHLKNRREATARSAKIGGLALVNPGSGKQ